jgi:hypothetical protein
LSALQQHDLALPQPYSLKIAEFRAFIAQLQCPLTALHTHNTERIPVFLHGISTRTTAAQFSKDDSHRNQASGRCSSQHVGFPLSVSLHPSSITIFIDKLFYQKDKQANPKNLQRKRCSFVFEIPYSVHFDRLIF